MKTVVGFFEHYQNAEHAINELVKRGFPKHEISIIVRNNAQPPETNDDYTVAEGVGAGALGGTALGGLAGLLIGIGTLTIPGIGTVIAAGTLTSVLSTTFAGAGVGAVAGGLIGVLVSLGIPESDAQMYAEGVGHGGVLVAVQTDTARATAALGALQSEAIQRSDAQHVALREVARS